MAKSSKTKHIMYATVEAAKQLRKAAGISQRDIAAAIHKSNRDVGLIESHNQTLTFKTGCSLLAYLRSCPGVQADPWVRLVLNFFFELVEDFAWTLDPQLRLDKITERTECSSFMDLGKGSCLAANFILLRPISQEKGI
jgi:transcriptional regulator with XRE-family HTH domain